MGMHKSVSNGIAKGTLKFLAEQGLASHVITTKCDISDYEIQKNGGRLGENQHYKFMLESSKHCKSLVQKMLEHSIEHRILNVVYNEFPELIGFNLNQESAEKAVESFLDNRFIIGNCDSIVVTRCEVKTKIEYINMGPAEIGDHSAIGNFMMLYDLIKKHDATKNIKIGFTNNHNEEKRLLNDFFESHCSFSESSNFIILDNHLIERKTASINESVYSMQKSLLAKKKAEIEIKMPFTTTVTSLIKNAIYSLDSESDASIMNHVCSSLKVSRWTLSEKLKNENSNFTDLLKKTRLQLACSLLLETDKSIQEISELICFSSMSVFSRFFKSNMNISPLSYRNKNIE
nr:helix-turn-helix transcriptional regulator [uncultured Tolumonas sp.]